MSVEHELLDVVDENDVVIETRTRGEIHRLGLMHRSVHVLVFNEAGHLFIQKRSMNKDESPGKWDCSAAGHVDSGEEYADCAVRELEEELGFTPGNDLMPLFKVRAHEDTGMEHCWVYQVTYDGPMVLQAEEIDEGRWLAPEELDKLVAEKNKDLTAALQRIWGRLRQHESRLN